MIDVPQYPKESWIFESPGRLVTNPLLFRKQLTLSFIASKNHIFYNGVVTKTKVMSKILFKELSAADG